MEKAVKNIMVVKLRTLGDILTTFPLLRALRELYPAAKLHMVADEAYRSLFTGHPRVNQFWGHPAGQLKNGGVWQEASHVFDMARRIRQAGVDLYIDLYGSSRTALWGALARVPQRLGFELRGRRHFYTQTIRAQYRYVVELNLQFAWALGYAGQDRSLEFFLEESDHQSAADYLAQHPAWSPGKPYAVISPGGGWPLKIWGAERWGAAARQLQAATGCQILISGANAEAPLVRACGAALGGDYVPVIGLPLRQLAAVIHNARLYMGNDSGPKYFAEAFNVPTLICYGPTDFLNNNPPSRRRAVAFRPVACRPCHSEKCGQARRICLDDLAVAEVATQAIALWQVKPDLA